MQTITRTPYGAHILEGAGAPRPIVPGEYHHSDLMNTPKRKLIQIYRGELSPEGIDAWLAKRGKIIEAGIRDPRNREYHDVEVHLPVKVDGDTVTRVGTIDELRRLNGEASEVVEIKSQFDSVDDTKEGRALEQGTGYAVDVNDPESKIYRRIRIETADEPDTYELVPLQKLGPVVMVNVCMAGLYSIEPDNPYLLDPALSKQVRTFLDAATALVHRGVLTGDYTEADAWDLKYPSIERTRGFTEVPEIREAARQYAMISRAISVLEQKKEELKGRSVLTFQVTKQEGHKDEWGTFKKMQKETPTERCDKEALKAFLEQHGATLDDFFTTTKTLGKPYVQHWPSKACRQTLAEWDVREAFNLAIPEAPPLPEEEKDQEVVA